MSETPEPEPSVTARALKSVLLRSAIAAVGLAPLLALAVHLLGAGPSFPRLLAAFTLPCLGVGLVRFVERAAANRAPSVARDAVSGLAAWLLVTLVVGLGFLEYLYLEQAVRHARALSFGEGVAFLHRELSSVDLEVVGALTLPAAWALPTTIGRARGHGVLRTVGTSVAFSEACVVVAGFAGEHLDSAAKLFAVLAGGPSILFPLLFRVADAVEARLLPPEKEPA